MKLYMKNVSPYINRTHDVCGKSQWTRETYMNAKEAGATRVEFGVEFQAVEKLKVYRRMISDNGCGMSEKELLEYYGSLGVGAKTIKGIHDNYGIGAKVSLAVWNPNGIIVISYKNGVCSMVWLWLDDVGDYALRDFKGVDGGLKCVIDPRGMIIDGINWGEVAPSWCREHGTCIILLGSHDNMDTVLGDVKSKENSTRDINKYLNNRFVNIPDNIKVTIIEFNSADKKELWPINKEDKQRTKTTGKGNKYTTYATRRAMGSEYYLTEVKAQKNPEAGGCAAKGVLDLDNGKTKLYYYLWEGEKPQVHPYARIGYIAYKYKGELFGMVWNQPVYKNFGITDTSIRERLTLVIEPPLHTQENGWGVQPDQSRNSLSFTGGDDKSVDLPLMDWGKQFSQNLPEEIVIAIRKLRENEPANSDMEEDCRRIQGLYGDRWAKAGIIEKTGGDTLGKRTGMNRETGTTTCREGGVGTGGGGTGGGGTGGGGRQGEKAIKMYPLLDPVTDSSSADALGVTAQVRNDIPKWKCRPSFFEDDKGKRRDWIIASYSPNEVGGPTVLINSESKMIKEQVEWHTNHNQDEFAEEIKKIIYNYYGKKSAIQIAHSQSLTKVISEQILNDVYRSEESLTFGLMGIVLDDILLGKEIKKKIKKLTSAAAEVDAQVGKSSNQIQSDCMLVH